jgi:hypothetical protein
VTIEIPVTDRCLPKLERTNLGHIITRIIPNSKPWLLCTRTLCKGKYREEVVIRFQHREAHLVEECDNNEYSNVI